MGKARQGNRRLMITLPNALIDRLEQDTQARGLALTKSARIQLALENELSQKKNKGRTKK